MYLKLNSRENLFAHNLIPSGQIILKIYTDHGSDTAVLCVNFQNDLMNETNVLGKQRFERFESKMSCV